MARRTLAALALTLSVAGLARAGDLGLLDVPEDHWARDSLEVLFDLGLIEGYPDGTFRGNEPLGRFDGAILFVRLGDYLTKKFELPAQESRSRLQLVLLSPEEKHFLSPTRQLSLLKGAGLPTSLLCRQPANPAAPHASRSLSRCPHLIPSP